MCSSLGVVFIVSVDVAYSVLCEEEESMTVVATPENVHKYRCAKINGVWYLGWEHHLHSYRSWEEARECAVRIEKYRRLCEGHEAIDSERRKK